MFDWKKLGQRLDGKWQIPLVAVSLVMLGGAVLRVLPRPTKETPQRAISYLDTNARGGLYERVIEVGQELLAREDYTDRQRAEVHLYLARARSGKALRERAPTVSRGRRISHHYEFALDGGVELSTDDHKKLGDAYEWQRRFDLAIHSFERVLDAGIDQPLDLQRHIVDIMHRRLNAPTERIDAKLDSLLAAVGQDRLDLRVWALERKMEVLDLLGRVQEAATLLARDKVLFSGSVHSDHFEYLEALLLFHQGLFDDTERRLRTVRNRIDTQDPLYAKSGWLLGRTVLSDGGPQRPAEALSFFNDVMSSHPSSPYAVASRVGAAEALGMLERHDEALAAYRVAVDQMDRLERNAMIDRDVLRVSVSISAELQRHSGHYRAAVDYARLAAKLTDDKNVELATLILQRLTQSLIAFADSVSKENVVRKDARDAYREAAETFILLSEINRIDQDRAAEFSWLAAELYESAGAHDEAAKGYRSFAIDRPEHALVARALLRLGRLHQAIGQLEPAVEAYKECYRRFPRTIDGSRSLVPLAQVYLAMGAGKEELAEKTLRIALEESDVFTPEAPEFADSLYLLGDVLNRRGLFEQAIGTLEEALDRYPVDPRTRRAQFLLADSYRHSGLGLKADVAGAKSTGEIEQMRAELTNRFQKAAKLYRTIVTRYENADLRELTRLEEVYLRHSYLYEADCYFEIQSYARALKLYEESAATYKDTPSGLAAYVQVINCHVFLGKTEEARAALARAMVLVDDIPDEAFSSAGSPEKRADWKRYFEWLGESELF